MVDAVREMQMVMKEIVGQLQSGDFHLTDDGLQKIRNDLLAVSVTAVDILNGAAYLFQKEPDQDNQHWKADLELEQLRKALELEENLNSDKNVEV
jgi:predicted acylesterase/phospholipase RssA